MELVVDIRGVQPSTVKSGATAWRVALAEAAKAAYPDAPYGPVDASTFAVEIEFRLVRERLFVQPNRPVPPDLDNLLKPVLDTLFTSDNVVGPTAALVDRNDTFVTELRTRKVEAPSSEEEGAHITVRWAE